MLYSVVSPPPKEEHPRPGPSAPEHPSPDTLVGAVWRTSWEALRVQLGAVWVTSLFPTLSNTEPGTRAAAGWMLTG